MLPAQNKVVKTETIVTVKPEPGRRGTVWAIYCSDENHKKFPGQPLNKRVAIQVAQSHSYEEHDRASVKVLGNPKPRKKRK